jgi:phosphate transport system substrate-binding protein
MKTQTLFAFVIIATLLLTACGGTVSEAAPAPAEGPQMTLKISGSGSTTTILAAIKPAFESDTPGYQLKVLQGSGTGAGVKGVIEGSLDVAAMARPLKEEEAAEGLEYVELGQGAVGVLVHPGVDVADLTAAQVVAIFSGEVTNWSEVGGPNAGIILYVRDEKDTSTEALRQAILGETPFPETAQVLTSQGDMESAVAGTPYGVGIGSWSSVLATGSAVESVTLDGITPGDPLYPMLKAVGIGFKAERRADVQPLIDWLLSEKGRAALRELDVILPH